MFSVKAMPPSKIEAVLCNKCKARNDYKDGYCERCGESLPQPGSIPPKPQPPPAPTMTGPDYIGSITVGDSRGGFTIDPKTGQKKYTSNRPPPNFVDQN